MQDGEDIEMIDANLDSPAVKEEELEERKRFRSSSESIMKSPSSSVIATTTPDLTFDARGVQNFKSTQLEVIEESEFSWDLSNWAESATSPTHTIGGTEWMVNYNVTERSSSGNKIVGIHLAVPETDPQRKENPGCWAVCAEFILAVVNPQPEAASSELKAASPTMPSSPQQASTASPATTTSSFASMIFSPLKSVANSSNSNLSTKSSRPPLTFAHSSSEFHRFCQNEDDWGFPHFLNGSAFKTGKAENGCGPLATAEGATRVIVKIRVVKDKTGVLWHSFSNYDSKEVTGYVGLLNQGATCYMNSFVQSIFLTNEFRQAVYKIPTESEHPYSSIPLALQRIFYKLQVNSQPPSTIEMTKSFGWDTADSFMQHDVQEFSRVLLDDLENKMKGSEVEGTVERLFRGQLKNVLMCINVDYESVREEFFYDLQLTIRGVKDLQESLDRYVAAEMLCGDNQYRTDNFGLQDAKKFVTFQHFPPVLHIHLERYAFDLNLEATVKIHDRFEFPVEIALDPYLAEGSPDRAKSQLYWLHSVLVHAGDGHGGHYFVYIRHPSQPDVWYKFDDTKVVPCTVREAVDENFGGYEWVSSEEVNEMLRSTGIRPYKHKKYTSAYLLVYIRKADLDTVLAPVPESQVPEYLIERIKADDLEEARRRHERQQQYLYTQLQIISEVSTLDHSGSDLFDPENASSCTFRCRRDDNLSSVSQEYAMNHQLISEPAEEGEILEFYNMAVRKNKTLRVEKLVAATEEQTVGSLVSQIGSHNSTRAVFLRRAVQNSVDPWLKPILEGQIFVFFKWFDAKNEKLKILGGIPVFPDQKILEYLPAVQARIPGFDAEMKFDFYEEFKPSKILSIDVMAGKTFKDADLRFGDIILIELHESKPSVVDFFSDLTSWRPVDIKPVNHYDSTLATFEDSKISVSWTVAHLQSVIADRLKVNPQHLRLAFSVESMSVDLTTVETLINAQFLPSNQMHEKVEKFLRGASVNDIVTIKYEVTEEPVVQAENQSRFFIESNIENFMPRAVYLTPYVSTVSDLLHALGIEDVSKYRLLEAVGGKIRRTFVAGGENESLTTIEAEKCSLYLEEMTSSAKSIACFAFEKNPAKPFGIPFKIDLRADENVKSLKQRLAQKLTVTPDAIIGIFLFNGHRDRKLDDPTEIPANLPGGNFSDENDQLGVMLADPSKTRLNSASDGAIRFRK